MSVTPLIYAAMISASLFCESISADDKAELTLNGVKLRGCSGHKTVFEYDVTPFLKAGGNSFEVALSNLCGPVGMAYVIDADGKTFFSGPDTRFSFDGKTGWVQAHSFGKPPVSPWGAPDMFIVVKPEKLSGKGGEYHVD
ncbi:MAG: hypothetical protein BWY31_02535 [Lentisphaerae bacterium ADurb.Bin242]|nr:MAG: hypothetical protein BWY31_02535 [Lentisphaerae bacterium ADurb.Bin242]